MLALIAGQDVEPGEGSEGTDGRWRIARRVTPDRVISTVDPQARHAHKTRARRQDGYQAHIVAQPDTGIISDTALTPAAGADNSDAAIGVELLLDTDQQPEQPERWEVLADCAYGTGEALDAIARAGHTAIVKPWPLAVAGGFTLDDFLVVEPSSDQPGSVSCPNGLTRPITARRRVTFGARCITNTTGRSLTLRPLDATTRAHRQHAQDPQFQASTTSTGR